MRERKTTKHAVYTLEEKERILEQYLSGAKRPSELEREYDLGNTKKLREWRDMKLKHGRLVDRRGKRVEGSKPRGRPKSVRLEEMNRGELIKHIRMIDDIKKAMAYLRKHDPNIK
jgi:transposase-like protein